MAESQIWYGRPDMSHSYNETSVHFMKSVYRYGPPIEGNFWFGHHYEMFNMARALSGLFSNHRPANHFSEMTTPLGDWYSPAANLRTQL
jgi:hypothetical protein